MQRQPEPAEHKSPVTKPGFWIRSKTNGDAMLRWLTGPSKLDLRAQNLYGAVVTGARNPMFYWNMRVPDTPEGRFELVALHLFLALERVKDQGEAGQALAQRTIETFVTDMDDCMREMGVGDMVVSKKVKRAAAAFYERSRLYRAALGDEGDAALIRAIEASIEPAVSQPVDAPAIAAYMRAAQLAIAAMPLDALAEGQVSFPQLPFKR